MSLPVEVVDQIGREYELCLQRKTKLRKHATCVLAKLKQVKTLYSAVALAEHWFTDTVQESL